MVLTTSMCASWMGVDSGYIAKDIQDGLLPASNIARGVKPIYRIYYGHFLTYLHVRHWSHLPTSPSDLLVQPFRSSDSQPSA